MGLLRAVHFAPFGLHGMCSTVTYHIRHRLFPPPDLPIAIPHVPPHPFHHRLPGPFKAASPPLSRRTPHPFLEGLPTLFPIPRLGICATNRLSTRSPPLTPAHSPNWLPDLTGTLHLHPPYRDVANISLWISSALSHNTTPLLLSRRNGPEPFRVSLCGCVTSTSGESLSPATALPSHSRKFVQSSPKA